MRASTVAKIAVIAALITVLVILLIVAVMRWRCYLDVLNWAIRRQCRSPSAKLPFDTFYAGVPGRPATRDVRIPGKPGLGAALGRLEDSWREVRTELDAVLIDRDKLPALHETYGEMFGVTRRNAKSRGSFAGWLTRTFQRAIYGDDIELVNEIVKPDWKTFNLVIFGHNIPGNADRCPRTVSLLHEIPGFQSAFFSIMAPGAYIAPHCDISKGVIRYHLGLKIPRDRDRCYISVAGQRYHWTEGAGVLFEDAFEHYVDNDTDEERVILFVDIARPLTGLAGALQGLADVANRYQPSVRRLMEASRVKR